MPHLTDHLSAALSAIHDHDKQAAVASFRAAEACFDSGYHPARYYARAAECAVDISNWPIAAERTQQALSAAQERHLQATG